MPFPRTLEINPPPKIIFFTDFDGTITLKDCNDYMTDHYGYGREKRRVHNTATLEGKETFRDSFRGMVDSWTVSFPQVIEILKADVGIDPYFRDFVQWAKSNGIPIIVLSSGMVPVIRAMLQHLLGPELASGLEIIANEPTTRPPGNSLDVPNGWTIQYHDDSGFGHDKSLTIRPYATRIAQMPEAERPTLLYAGDGVSDLSAARETDLLFAKAGHDLITYCEREGIPFTTFEDWSSILAETKEIFQGRKSVRNVAEEGLIRHRTNSLTHPPPRELLEQIKRGDVPTISRKVSGEDLLTRKVE